MRAAVYLQIVRTTLREFLRTPEALFWTYGFPLIMAVVLGLAFAEKKEPPPVHVGVLAGPAAELLAQQVGRSARLRPRVLEPEAARLALSRGQVDLLLGGDPQQPKFVLDPTRPECELARLLVDDALQRAAGRTDPLRVEIRHETQPGHRYIDFLIPGLIGLNLLGSGLWGIGYNLVDMRSKKLLKRLLVTPMRRSEFLFGFLSSRIVLAVPESIAIAIFGSLVFGVPWQGSWLLMLALILACALAFNGLGTLIASRPRTLEGVAGLMNLVQLPMWLLGGSFFATSHFPDWLQPVVRALPLTQFNDAMRETMRGGDQGPAWFAIAYLTALACACFALAVRFFRWG